MNAEKKVFSRLFTEDKTELATQKIELSVIDDIDKMTSKGLSDMLEASSLAQKAIKSYDSASQVYAQAENLSDKAISQAQDLGAKQLVKQLKSKSSNISKDIKRANSISNKIKSLI